MRELSQKELTELGDHFLECAKAVGDYRYKQPLSPQSDKMLSDMHWKLLNYSDEFYLSSTQVSLDSVGLSLHTIRNVTKEMQDSLHQIRNVQKAIDVAAAAIALAAALLSKNPKGVKDALNKFVEEL